MRNNHDTAAGWDRYAPHRRRLTALVSASASGGTLCVLGAGNANDLELEALARQFSALQLVDIDPAALARAAARQGALTRERLQLHGGLDLSGLGDRLDTWTRRPPEPAVLAALPTGTADFVARALPGPFDLVVSTCLLSQICRACHRAFGDAPAAAATLADVASAAVATHLQVMLQLTAPGGACLLVTDTISSETYPLEELFTPEGGPALLEELARGNGLITGTNPRLLSKLLRHDPVRRSLVQDLRLEAPWLWELSPTCTLLVYALAFRRRPA